MADNINPIENREYELSPAVSSGNDKECVSIDFYQEEVKLPTLGRLGLGMKVVHKKTNIPYVIINFEKEKVTKLNLRDKINSTIDFMYKTSHPYFFRLLNHYETDTHVFLIFESYDGDSLDHIIQEGKCDLATSLKYFVEVLLAIQYMHTMGRYNINIYPENILIGECVKLTDYDLKMAGMNEAPERRIISVNKNNINHYFPPEEIDAIISKTEIEKGPKYDSWHCGIFLYEMLTNFQTPFKGDKNNNEEYYYSLMNADIDLSLIHDDFCKQLISQLIRKNPEERLDIEEILSWDYIKNISIEQPEIDPRDNIINPDYNEEELEKIRLIEKLKAENENLKKALEKYKEYGNKRNSKISVEMNKNDSKKLDDKNEKDKEEKEKNGSSSEEDDDMNSSSSEDLDNENLYVKCEKYKEKYSKAKEKIKKLEKKNKKLNSEVSQLQKEKKQIQEQKALNILNNLENIKNSKIKDINELSETILNSVNLFRESQHNLEGLIEKLITLSSENNIALTEANKQYIDEKSRKFFLALEEINVNKNKDNEIDINKEREERKKMDKKKDLEINDLKRLLERSKEKEALLNEKIKALEDRNNVTLQSYERLKILHNIVSQTNDTKK